MADRLNWTQAALDDLKEIATFIARDSPSHAAIVVRRINEACEQLLGMTVATAVVPESDRADVRQIHVYNYRVILKFTEGAVIVVAVFHGARDIGRTLSPRL